jgi:hypothetical protein
MGAAQPLNTAILVHRTVRSYRHLRLHRSVFQTFQRVAPEVMAVVGREGLTTLETRDATVTTDTSLGGRLGLPIVRYEQDLTLLADAVATISGLNFPVRIGQDKFLEKSDANVTDDLQANLRSVAANLSA